VSAARWAYDTTACVDCFYAVAGVESDSEPVSVPLSSVDRGEFVELGWLFAPKELRESPGGELSLGFSWSPCECCGSTLGGDRFAVSMWTRD